MSNVRYELSEREPQGGPRVLYVAVSVFGEDWLSLPHDHPHAELLFVTEGAGRFRLAETEYPLRRGDLVIVNPNLRHTELSSSESPLRCLIVGVENAIFSDDGQNPSPVYRFSGRSESAALCLGALERELSEKPPGYLSAAKHLASALLVCATRCADLRGGNKTDGSAAKECSLARQYLDEHFAEDISVDELAAITFTNKYHLIHLFSREYGISPIAYLMEKRISEAKHLLRETRMSVTEISKVTGFSSPSFFAKRFGQSVGLSPLAYRKSGAKKRPVFSSPEPYDLR